MARAVAFREDRIMRRILPWLIGAIAAAACGASPMSPACSGLNFTGTATVRGTVTSNGAGAGGATVTIAGRSTTTAADGTFSIAGLTSGALQLSVGPPDSPWASGTLNAFGGDNVVRVPVARGNGDGFLAGRTIDGCSGLPLGGVTVSVGAASATSDANGLYELDGLCCSTLPALTASRAGYQTFTTELGRVYDTSEWMDIVLQR